MTDTGPTMDPTVAPTPPSFYCACAVRCSFCMSPERHWTDPGPTPDPTSPLFYCARAVRCSFCMSLAWGSAPREARFSIVRYFFWISFVLYLICHSIDHFMIFVSLLRGVSNYQTYIMMLFCLRLGFLTATWFDTCDFIVFELVSSSLHLIWVPLVLDCNFVQLGVIVFYLNWHVAV